MNCGIAIKPVRLNFHSMWIVNAVRQRQFDTTPALYPRCQSMRFQLLRPEGGPASLFTRNNSDLPGSISHRPLTVRFLR